MYCFFTKDTNEIQRLYNILIKYFDIFWFKMKYRYYVKYNNRYTTIP